MTAEFIDVMTFNEVIDLWKWLFNILEQYGQYGSERKSRRYVNLIQIQKEVLLLLTYWIRKQDLQLFEICLDHVSGKSIRQS